jgi:hypothetical protein
MLENKKLDLNFQLSRIEMLDAGSNFTAARDFTQYGPNQHTVQQGVFCTSYQSHTIHTEL